ncbi:MAG: DNA-processing protein DprA [Spirochaetae bacterium HGW-Spirochaetae-2]|jgi:DNA processing protein|nr:MAG: DNA-processing protein DprA [Spirochaetae bacterium HGW-Spirochaetae-2]
MDIAALSAKHIQEAINYETVLLCSRKSESHIEPIFERIGEIVSLTDPMTLHPNTYAESIGVPAQELLETHSHVKARFLRLDDADIVLKRGDNLYPQTVARIPGSPRFLYLRGDLRLLDTKCVCVIGTRNPSNEGKTYAKETVQELAGHMVTIVSGLALGIDGIAHITSLATGTSTIAVLGTPLTEAYPAEHRKLQKIIGEKGLLVTRFSPATQTQKWHFLLRNQLMSSLSVGSIVVEDRDGGGAVKQAQYALDQQRKVVLFQHVLDNRSLLWPRRLSLKSGVLVVKHPGTIHARLFAPATQVQPQELVEARPAQLSLFDLS